eukprot:sb/3474387/
MVMVGEGLVRLILLNRAQPVWRRRPDLSALRIKWGMAPPYRAQLVSILRAVLFSTFPILPSPHVSCTCQRHSAARAVYTCAQHVKQCVVPACLTHDNTLQLVGCSSRVVLLFLSPIPSFGMFRSDSGPESVSVWSQVI